MCSMKAMTHQDLTAKPEPDQQNVELDDVETSTAAQMEWDPQTDVASPMLSVQGITPASYY